MLSPIDLIGWALAAIVVALAIFLIVVFIVATVRTIRKPKKPSDHNIIGGRK